MPLRQKLELMTTPLCVSADPKIPPTTQKSECVDFIIEMIPHWRTLFKVVCCSKRNSFRRLVWWSSVSKILLRQKLELMMTTLSAALCLSAKQTVPVPRATSTRECVPSLHDLVVLFLIVTRLNSFDPKWKRKTLTSDQYSTTTSRPFWGWINRGRLNRSSHGSAPGKIIIIISSFVLAME